MDLLTHAALGGVVGELTLGKQTGNRAVFWGVIGGLLPDVDILLRWTHGDLNHWLERAGFTHSLLFVLLTPWLFGWLVKALENKRFPSLRRRSWGWLFFWVFITHVALDCCGIWGVQLMYPFWRYHIALNCISYLDPLFSLPLIIGLFLGVRHASNTKIRATWMGAGLVISSLYLIFTFTNRQFIRAIFANSLRQDKRRVIRYETYPTPGNTLLWYGVAEEAYGYTLGYYSLLNGGKSCLSLIHLPKQHILPDSLVGLPLEDRMQEASHRYYNLEQRGDTVLWHDLRFGLANVAKNELSPLHYTMSYALTYDQRGKPDVNQVLYPILWNRDQLKIYFGRVWGASWE